MKKVDAPERKYWKFNQNSETLESNNCSVRDGNDFVPHGNRRSRAFNIVGSLVPNWKFSFK